MSEGVFTLPKVNSLVGSDFTRTSAAVAAGTAGVLLVAAKQGRLYRLYVLNGSATAYFLQVFDKAGVCVNNDVPIWEKRLAVSSEVELDFTNVNGLYFANGLSFAISSTANVLTLAVANNVAFSGAIFTQNV